MAIRYRQEYGSWQVYWNDPKDGKRHSKTFRDKIDAEKYNSALVHAAKLGRLADVTTSTTTTCSNSKTFGQLYIDYVCEKQFTKRVLACHRSNCLFFLDYLQNRALGDISASDLEYIKTKMVEKFSPATAHDRLSILRTLIYYAIRKGYMPAVVFPRIPAPRYKQNVPPTPEEIQRMYAVAPPHIQRVLILGSAFGMRIGRCELFQLTWSDVDFERNVLRIHGSKKNDAAQYREVPIRRDLVPVFGIWKAEDAKIGAQYIIHYGTHAVQSIKRSWRTVLKTAGITRYIRPYDLRHAFGTELVAAGVDIATVAHLMGHSSPQMLLKHYLFVLDKQKISAVEQLPTPPICAARHMSQV